MTEGVSSSEDAAAARAAEQVRLRKQRREAKIKAGGSSRLDRITGLGGGFARVESPAQAPASTESSPARPAATPTPAASSDAHADPEEVDISQHYYAPQTTARPPPADPSNMSEAQLRQMMLGFEQPSPAASGTPPPRTGNPFLDRASAMAGMTGMEGMDQDPAMQLLQKMMAGGMPDGADGSNPFAGMGLEGLLGAAGGSNTTQPGQQVEQGKNLNLWRILHAIFALGLGIYVTLSTTFTGTKIERDTDDLRSTGVLGAQNLEQARAWFFYVFTSVEAVLLTSRYMVEREAGFTPTGWAWTITGMLPNRMKNYSRHALRYSQIFTTVRNDALFCIFVMGVCSLLRS
ncbi:putative sad1 interacting factor 1 protein [Rosellinia necatrix]|uniref:Putative sad1 interacting factor 1 protein n=1 Tax=Rosellinia necatrix TaxID=77044 RepID=A0A1S7UL09_ROSNE|nr:putative sad1 interacting factor 1 protein [Rosellinia necatrix]